MNIEELDFQAPVHFISLYFDQDDGFGNDVFLPLRTDVIEFIHEDLH